ncbi:MAG: hypothetical protein ACO3A2_06575 [Bdellovibrionia bacterium]
MLRSHVNQHPLLLMINYWELKPALLQTKLDELMDKGVSQICSFIPWQLIESDISHTLSRFLGAAAERRMKVYLIFSPEIGIHYLNSGLPKDVISKKENRAIHVQSGLIPVNLPPNTYTLPSFFAPEFNKRYYSYLVRIDNILADLAKNQPSLLKNVTGIVTGSFWKYYRSAALSSSHLFGGPAGDYSSHASVAFRQRVEATFSQREFIEGSSSTMNRWKTRALEESNRKWFYQQSEDVFRTRTFQVIQKKSSTTPVLELELFTPEADPSSTYSNFLQMMTAGQPDFWKFSRAIEESAARVSIGSKGPTLPFVQWTSVGTFKNLSDSQKQFLILKSLLLHGGSRGGILLDESEWFQFSESFRNRTEALGRYLGSLRIQSKVRAQYYAPHLWSNYGPLWSEFSQKLGPSLKMVASLDLVLNERNSRLLIVDPSVILTEATVRSFFSWLKAGRVLVLPKTKLMTQAAKTELEFALEKHRSIEMEHGLNYKLYSIGDSKLIIYDPLRSTSVTSPLENSKLSNPPSKPSQSLSALQTFIDSVIAVSDLNTFYRLSDGRLMVIPFEKKSGGLALFVLNSTQRQVSADVMFPSDVQIEDLGISLAGSDSDLELFKEPHPTAESLDAVIAVTHRFSIDVPAFGILSFGIDSPILVEKNERELAAQTSPLMQENVLSAAHNELPGFNASDSFEELWN